MKSLAIRWEACVRTRAVAAGCRACVDACPTAALDLSGPRASVAADLARCAACGLCEAACPTEAISSDFDAAAIVASGASALRCGEGVPCVGALSAEDLAALALSRGQIQLTAAGSCAVAGRHAAIVARAAEVNAFLAAAGAAGRVFVQVEAEASGARPAAPRQPPEGEAAPPRRAFFARLLPSPPAPAPPVEPARLVLDFARLDVKAMRTTAVPRRRLRLLDALAADAARRPAGDVNEPAAKADRVPAAAIGWSSSKSLDTSACTASMLCVNACPTGALTTSALRRELRFDASRCVKCATCHDVCEPRAITVAPMFDVAAFTARADVSLGRLLVRMCGECGAPFKREGDEALCPRCRALDDEARELSGMR